MSEGAVSLVANVVVVLVVAEVVFVEWALDRWGRVPVISPVWDWIRGCISWWLAAPGRAVRWLHGRRDTPPGLGGA